MDLHTQGVHESATRGEAVCEVETGSGDAESRMGAWRASVKAWWDGGEGGKDEEVCLD